MKQVFISALMLIISVLQSYAYDFKVGDLYYTILSATDKIVEVVMSDENTGTVEIPDKVVSNGVSYRVESIGRSAFASKSMTKLLIGNNVKLIKTYAFCDCEYLTEIKWGNGLNTIEQSAFKGCLRLTNVELPDGLISIGDWAMAEGGVTRIVIPKSVKEIGTYAFLSNYKLKELVYNAEDCNIGDKIFADCSIMSKVEIGESVKVLPNYIFNGCSGIMTVVFSNNIIESIGAGAFYQCKGLRNIELPKSLTSIGNSAFQDCINLKNIVIPNNVTSIGSFAFQNCTLEKVKLPANITEIPNGLFTHCNKLYEVELPLRLSKIGDYAFTGCAFADFEISNNIMELGINVFKNCKALKTIKIGSGIAEIPAGSFEGCISLEEIELHDNIGSVGASAFKGCISLKEIELPKKLESILANAFDGCSNIVDINIPQSIKSIEKYAFRNCSSLKSISVNTNISLSAFYGCISLKRIDLGEKVSMIESSAFYDCYNIRTIYSWNKVPPKTGNLPGWTTEKIDLYVPKGTLRAYATSFPWESFRNIYEMQNESGVEETFADADSDGAVEVARYDVNGKLLTSPVQGLNIVKLSNGKVKKEFVK